MIYCQQKKSMLYPFKIKKMKWLDKENKIKANKC